MYNLENRENLKNQEKGVIPVDLTNKNPVQLFHELSLLLAEKQAENKNTLGKASIILDNLKNNKPISEKKYNKMLAKFTS